MREQPSKRALELRLEWINKALGKATVAWVKNEDGKGSHATNAVYIDHCNGGYRLECGGSPIFGQYRMTKFELCNQMEAILAAIRLARGEDNGAAWPSEAGEINVAKMRDALELASATIERLQRHAPGSAQGTLDVIKNTLA